MTRYRTIPIRDVIVISVDGRLDLEASKELLLDVAKDTELSGRHLLLDIRGTESTHDYREIFQLVQVLLEHPTAFTGRIALLTDYGDRFEKAQFFQAAATDNGFRVRAFFEPEPAVAWLQL